MKPSFTILNIAAAILTALLATSAHASSTRGMVVSIEPIPGSTHCTLVIEDEFAKRKLSFVAHASVCEQRAQWVGKTALFHLSLVDLGQNRLEPMATRVKAWPEKTP